MKNSINAIYYLMFIIYRPDLAIQFHYLCDIYQTYQQKNFKMCDLESQYSGFYLGEPKYHSPSICKSENVWQKP